MGRRHGSQIMEAIRAKNAALGPSERIERPRRRAPSIANDVYEGAKNKVCAVTTFDVTDDRGAAISVGSGWATTHMMRTGTFVITAAHVVLPDFAKVNAANHPYVLQGSGKVYGLTTLNEWPFRYMADMYNATTARREFFELDLLGVDWHTDVAVLEVLTEGGETFDTFELCSDSALPGDPLYSLNNLWAMHAQDIVSGSVRVARSQSNVLFRDVLETTLDLAEGSSGAAVLNALGEVESMYTSGYKVPGVTFTTGPSCEQLSYTIQSIIEGVNLADGITLHPHVLNFFIVLAIPRWTLGVSATLLDVNDLDMIQPIPINGGYRFIEPLPFASLEGFLKSRDLILRVRPHNVPSTVHELGRYDYHRVADEAIPTTVDTVKALTVIPWSFGGYGTGLTEAQSYDDLPLYDEIGGVDVARETGKSWSWWFQWLLTPAGAAPTHRSVSSEWFEDIVRATITRKQHERIIIPAPEFYPLGTYSTRGIADDDVPDEQTARVDAIVRSVVRQLQVYANAAGYGDDGDVFPAQRLGLHAMLQRERAPHKLVFDAGACSDPELKYVGGGYTRVAPELKYVGGGYTRVAEPPDLKYVGGGYHPGERDLKYVGASTRRRRGATRSNRRPKRSGARDVGDQDEA